MMKRSIASIPALLALLAIPKAWAEEDLPQAGTRKQEMVVSANPLASEAGAKVLKRGGTAADAMVAVQTVLGLVEPQSSGMGGGAFVVYFDAKTGTTTTVDAREKAPAAAIEDRFAGLGFFDAWQSGLSVGVPGTPRMMEYMQHKYGKLEWKDLFRDARKLASKGYSLTERTSSLVARLLGINASCDKRLFLRDPTAFEYFVDYNSEVCAAKEAGTRMKNPEYSKTMKKLAKEGADGFYTGEIAENIAAAVKGDLNMGGDMTVEDLSNYDVVERAPVCIKYRGHNACGMGPPSSGALAVGQILGILEKFDLSGLSPLHIETVHLFTQAGRLAFADRNEFVADSDFITVPVEGMLDKTYLAERAALIDLTMDMGTADAGIPPGRFDPTVPDITAKNSGTSHVSIVDRWGNVLSMSTTIESPFGNSVMVNGFLLNNELTDFSFIPSANGMAIANRVQANKRPRSSMSPTIVFGSKGTPEIATGSAGGSRIIAYTAQSIMNMIDFRLDPQEAINVPHFLNRNSPTDFEAPIPGVTLDYDAAALQAALEERGHVISPANPQVLNSGSSTIQVIRDKATKKSKKGKRMVKKSKSKRSKGTLEYTLIGGVDYRREGTVSGK